MNVNLQIPIYYTMWLTKVAVCCLKFTVHLLLCQLHVSMFLKQTQMWVIAEPQSCATGNSNTSRAARWCLHRTGKVRLAISVL